MAKGFNLTAQINLKGPNNLKPIVADIKRQIGSVELKINPRLDARAGKSITAINTRLKTMNDLLVTAKSNTDSLSAAFSNLSTSLASANSNTVNISGTMQKTATNAASTSKNIKQAATAMEEFGKQGFLAIKRFAAFSLVRTTIFSLINAINGGLSAFINFDKQLVKLQQVTGKGAIGLKKLEDQITNLSVELGVSSENLIEVASTLAQAGLNAEETRIALSALAKTELAPSFDDLTSTTEGAIAALRQFELQAGDLEAALGSINAVAAAFAVESSDIITAIQRTGGVFAAASRGVSEGKDALNEFIAVFTSVRATTRESAETIATGLRTIFTRIQRGKTIEALKEYGVVLTDLEGKFVGPFEAVKRLSEGLSRLDPRDLRFSQIVEELGGFRQIGKVIPLIQQFSEAQKALKVAQTGQSSLTDAQLTAQKSLANQIAKVREQFLALIRDVGKSATFQAITKIVLNLTSAFISLASAFKPILPFLAVLGTIKGVKAIGEFGTGFFGSFKKESGTPSAAQSIGSSIGGTISGSKEKEKSATTKLATDAIQANTSAIKALTIAISNLENTIKSKSTSGFFNGGKVLGFNSGGIVPGSGKGDKVPALLEPGEVVINNKAANKYGRGNLVRMNKLAKGGYSLYVDYADPERINPDFLDQGLSNIINDGIQQFTPRGGKGKETTSNSVKNFRLYRSVKGSILEESLRRAGAGQETNRGSFDYESWPGNLPAFDYMPSGIPADARLSKNRAEDKDSFRTKIQSYLSSAQGSNKNRTKFGAVVFEPGDDKTLQLKSGGTIKRFVDGGTATNSTGIYDSDKIGGSIKQSILGAILDSGKPYDVLHGPAGSGKTTLAQKMYGDNFILSAEDITKYAEFLILSGAGITKSGDFSPALMKILSGARNITSLNPDIKRLEAQRQTRIDQAILGGLQDTRSLSQLEATKKAPGSIASEVMKKFGEKTKILSSYNIGGRIQKFKDAGLVEEEYYGQKEVEAAKAARKALKKTIERMFVDKKGRVSFAVKRPVSMSENISQADREQFSKEGRIVSNPTTKLEELLTEKIIRTQATVATKSPQTKKKRGVDARLLRNLAKTGIQSDDKQIVEDAENAIKKMTPEQIKQLLMGDLKRAPEGEYLKKEAEYKLDPEFRKITGLDTGVKGGAVKQFEALAKENVTKGIFERASYLDRIPDALSQIQAFRANLVKKLAQEKDPKIQKNLQQYISKANTAIDVIKNKKGTPELPGQVTALSWAVRQSIPGAKELAFGGLVQKFPDGGVAESAIEEELNPQELIAWIEELGIPQEVRGLAGGNSYIDQMLAAVATKGKPVTSKEVFSKTFLKSDRASPYLSTVKKLLEIADANKKKPRIFTAEEKANATKVGLVGMLPFGLNETHYEEIAGKILSIHTATLPKDKVPAILQMRREIDEVLGRTTQNIFGNPGQNLDDPTKEALGLGNLEGYMIEAILAKAGANPGSLNDRSVDYQMGLGNAANLFGIEPNIPTEIKRDVKSGLSKARANFRNYFAKFASGGFVKSALSQSQKTIKWGKGPNAPTTTSVDPRAISLFSQKSTVDTIEQELSKLGISSLKFIGSGKDSLAYDAGNSVVKFSPGGLKRYSSNIPEQLKPSFAKLIEGYGVEVMPKVDTKVTESDLEELKKIITSKGYQWGDAALDNMGKLGNRLVVIDGDLTPLQMSSPSLPTKKFTGGLLSKLSSGGTVPAMVSAGEAFVPPKLAKKIGYGKLHKMNQADRNGMKGFSGGGISVFKGPGSGTSDSIGPIGLPEGSFIIREKATKALGLNKGGAVGLHRFKGGSPGGVPTSSTQGLSTNIVSNFEAVADSLGMSMYELAQTIQKTSSEARDAALAQGKSMQDAAKAAEEATAALLGLDQSISPGENPLEGKSYGTDKQKSKMSREAIRASGTVITNVETRRADRQRTLAPEGVTIPAPGDAAARASSKGFSRKDLISNMAGNTGAGTEEIIKTYNAITAQIAEAEARVKSLSNQQTDIRNAGGDSSEIDKKLSSAQAEAEALKASRTSKSAMAGSGQGIESDTGLSIVEYIQNFEKLNEAINNGAAKVAEAKKQEEQSYKAEAAAKNKAIQERMKTIEGGSLEDRYALAKEAVESGDYDKTSESGQALDRAKKNRQQAAKDRYSAEQSLETTTKEKTRLYGRSTNIEDSLESSRRLSGNGDPFYEAKKAADVQKEQAKTSPFGLGPEDPGAKRRREQNVADQEFIKYKADQTGTSESGVKLEVAQKLGRARYEAETLFKGKTQEASTKLVTRRDEAMKAQDAKTKATEQASAAREVIAKGGDPKKIAEAQSQLEAADLQLAEANRRLQSETEAVLQQMIELRPDLAGTEDGMKKLKAAAEQTANNLASGDLGKAQEVFRSGVAGSGEGGKLDDKEKAALARIQVSKETGFDTGLLEREFEDKGASAKLAKQQAFIQSREGQRFGKLAEFAPGLAQSISERGGERLGKAADFISGKGGKFSKGFAALGGFQGIGSGLAVGSEALKNSGLISKQTLKDPNVAGAFGAVQGAGALGATGAELGGQLAGPVGALVGGIGGAVIGGIKGFFDAKNAQVLSNALEKLTKSSESVDIAFKELAKNDTDANFKNVQKAFGQQIEASKELDAIAFGGGEGPTVAGVGGGALAGAAGGAVIGTAIAGPIGTAIGGALGGLVGGGVAYMSASQSKANREEALRNRVGSAGAMNESAARMAERQMGRMTNEQLEVSKQSGINLIAQQYKESAIAAAEANSKTGALTAKQKEKIGQDAMETAALDAYMKQRKEAGATDQQITDDILADRKAALQAGKQALDAQQAAARKQEELARATKQVAVVTESLLDVYRRVGANAQKFSDEIDDMLGGVQGRISSLAGRASVQKVDRSGSERVLGNISAYSKQEVEAATQEVVGKLGGGEEAQALGKQAQAAKFLQDRLPGLLKQQGANPNDIISEISQELGNMNIDTSSGPIKTMLDEIEKQIEKGGDSGLGTLADEISTGGIDKISATSAEALKQLQNLSKTYNDTLQKSIDLQNQYNEVVMQSNEYLRKAGTIRINAELDLAKALGNSPTLAQLNEPFDFEIRDLTKGLVAGGTTDPAAIAAGIVAKTEQNQALEQANKNIQNRGMTGATSGEAGAKLLAEQQKNIAAMGANSVAINEGRQALERLASDGTKAANALAKIEEQQRQIEGLGNRFEKIFTASPEELFKMNKQSAALQAAQVAGPEQFKSRAFRQDAFAGLEQDKEFLTGEEYRKQRGMLMRKSLEAQGFTGQSMIQKGGVNMTVDDFIKRIEGGMPNEEDPNVKAYREAVATQVQANEKLAKLNELQALEIQDAMIGLQAFLSTEFPKILTNAVIAAREDSETKPETTTSKPEKSKEQKQAELDIGIAGTNIQNSKEIIAGLDRKIKNTKDPKELKRLQAERSAEQNSMYNQLGNVITARGVISREQAKAKAKEEETKAAQAAEEKKTKESTVSSSIEQSQKAREGMPQPPIPAPPAPGTQSRREANQARAAELRQELKDIEQRGPQSIQNTAYTTSKSQMPEIANKPAISLEEMQKLEQLPSIADMQGFKEQKASEVAKLEKQVKIARISSRAAGPQGIKSQEYLQSKEAALASAKGDLSQLDKSIAAKQAAEAQKKAQEEARKQTQGKPEAAIVSAQGNNDFYASPKTGAGSERMADQFRNSMSVQPIQSNLPKPVEYTRQVQAAETGTTPSATKTTETSAQLITLDPASIEGLNTFNTNFGSYVDKLVNFQFPTIPEKIEMVGNHVVDVRVSGAAAFESIEKGMKDMINKAIDDKMTEIWKQTGGAIGNRPGAPPPKGK